jgi:hypothetical protein
MAGTAQGKGGKGICRQQGPGDRPLFGDQARNVDFGPDRPYSPVPVDEITPGMRYGLAIGHMYSAIGTEALREVRRYVGLGREEDRIEGGDDHPFSVGDNGFPDCQGGLA